MKILDRLPYFTEHTSVTVLDEAVRVKPYQIVVSISVSLPESLEWNPGLRSFPAILDTGNNYNVSIREGHLRRWAGFDLRKESGFVREGGRRIPLHAATVWVHQNVPKQRAVRGGTPYPLRLEDGIAVCPDEVGPRLPVLGLRALTQAALHAILDMEQGQITLRTADWFTKVVRFFSACRIS